MNRIFLAGLLGGIAMFGWSYLAYTALPVGKIGLRRMPNEIALLETLQKEIAENSGVYVFPGLRLPSNPPDGKTKTLDDLDQTVARYPSGLLIYNAAGSRPIKMFRWLSVDFLIELAEVALAVFLLSQTRLTTFVARVRFVLLIGIVAAIATNLSNWNWYGFPSDYTLAYMFIQIVGFLCAGLVAALVLRNQECGSASARSFLPRLSRAISGD